ncbi:MAG TPA: hypothetical protein VFQ14_04970 [Thermoleophilaceae bacterium]|nr:hypothetical protein [Thermoleophilaceae bacterium]
MSADGRRLAAVMACGPGAALSHRSAAALWSLRPYAGRPEVSIPAQACRSVPDVAIHRSRSLAAEDVTTVDGIPCTTVARTLLDLAASAGRPELVAAITRAEELRIYDGAAIEAALERARGKRGARLLREVLADWSDDRRRDQLLTRNGWTTLRAAYRQLDRDLAQTLRALLAR